MNEVLDRLWNESGDEAEDISGDELDQSDENDEDYMESESSDHDSFIVHFISVA